MSNDRFAGDRSSERVEILLVEDNPGDVRLTRDAFEQLSIETRIRVATDGDDALDELSERQDGGPDLVLLDLNLPRVDGFEFLETVRDDLALAHTPVLVLTGSSAAEDVLESYELAANAYLTKPTDPDEYAAMVEAVAEFWFDQAALPPVPT